MSANNAPLAVAHALATDMKKNPKGEDATAVCHEKRISAYGLFDGHGGPQCSHWMADGKEEFAAFLPRMLASGRRLPKEKAIADAFWSMDADVGAAMATAKLKNAGATATVLLVEKLRPRGSTHSKGHSEDRSSEPVAEGAELSRQDTMGSAQALGGLRCCLAWVGDSTGVTVDMSTGKVGIATKNHLPEVRLSPGCPQKTPTSRPTLILSRPT